MRCPPTRAWFVVDMRLSFFARRDAGHIRVPDGPHRLASSRGVSLENPIIANSVEELAIAGERAGFSSQDMIFMLSTGISMETLVDLIQWGARNSEPAPKRSSRWVM